MANDPFVYNLPVEADGLQAPNFFENALNLLSEVVATQGCKQALLYQLAATAIERKRQGRAILFTYLTRKRENANKEFYFAAEIMQVLTNSPTLNIQELRHVVQQTYLVNFETSYISSVAQWILHDETINTRKSKLEMVILNLKNDAQTVLEFVNNEAVSQFMRLDRVHAIDDGIGDIFQDIMTEAITNMQTLYGMCFHNEQLLLRAVNAGRHNQPFNFLAQPRNELPLARDTRTLASASEEVRYTFEAFEVSSYQSNCIFQALSLCLTEFTDPSYDIELRTRTIWKLIDDWDEYLTKHYADDAAEQPMAMENLLWSLRRFNAFSCRLMYAIPEVVEKNIDLLVVSGDMSRLRLRLEAAENPPKLFLATRDCNIDLSERNERLFHVVPLRPRSEESANDLQVAEADETVPLLRAYSRFGGGESDLPAPAVTEDRGLRPVACKFPFDWKLYRQTLKLSKASLREGTAQTALDKSTPMSIYGSNPRVMRREYERLQALCAQNIEVKKQFSSTAEHLRQEIERLEQLEASKNSDMAKELQKFEKRARQLAIREQREAKTLFKKKCQLLKREGEFTTFATCLKNAREQIEAKFSKALLDIESATLAAAAQQYSVPAKLATAEQPAAIRLDKPAEPQRSKKPVEVDKGPEAVSTVPTSLQAAGSSDQQSVLEMLPPETAPDKQSSDEPSTEQEVAVDLPSSDEEALLNKISSSDLKKQRCLGSGSFSVTHLASWKTRKQLVIFKEYSSLQLAKHEAEIRSQLSHRNIVKFLGLVTDAEECGIVTEYLENGTLYKLLHETFKESSSSLRTRSLKQQEALAFRHELDFKRVVSMARDIAKGMNYLHAEAPIQVVHRDLKSLNVLLTKSLRCKICGFEVAQRGKDIRQSSVVGTPAWMAPEVMRNESFNEKCDVYSFGVVMWEMITREVPFAKLRSDQVIRNVSHCGQRLPIDVNCPAELGELIAQCWKDQDVRPSFSAICNQLAKMAGNTQLEASANLYMADRLSIECSEKIEGVVLV